MITSFWGNLKTTFLLVILGLGLSLHAAGEEKASVSFAQLPATVSNSYTALAQLHLPSLAKLEIKEKEDDKSIEDHNKKLKPNNAGKIKVKNLGEVEKLRILYNVFAFHEELLKRSNMSVSMGQQAPEAILNHNVFNDLEIYCGNKPTFDHHLFGILDNTQTSLGKIQLQKMIYEPTSNIDELERRQKVVKMLLSNEKLFNTLDEKLALMKQSETDFAWFFKQLDETATKFFDIVYFQPGWFTPQSFNKSASWLEYLSLKRTAIDPTAAATLPLSMWLLAWVSQRMVIGALGGPYFSFEQWKAGSKYVAGQWWDGTKKFYQREDAPVLAKLFVTSTYLFMFYVYYKGLSMSLDIAKTNNMVTNVIHDKMIHVATLTNSMREMARAINENKDFASLIPNWTVIKDAFNESVADSDAAELLNTLKTETFKGKPSFFSNRGRVLNAFKQMQAVSSNMTASLKVAGELDAYLSIAKLYKKLANNQNAHYCFVNYSKRTTPELKISQFWHPVLNPEKVVTNSVELGGSKKSRNMILTGPNAGGKSTSLKAITIAIILAQTFGIAPADEMTLTPFALINTYLNIADSEGRESLFQAEMNRAHALLQSIKMLRPGQFSYVIMDEIFTGTNPKEGMAGAYGIAKRLSTFKNSMNIIATHFHVLTDLEKDTNDLFENYKVSIYREDGLIKYLYKLEKGISDQAIALELLQQAGFDDEILSAAQNVFDKQDKGFTGAQGYKKKPEVDEKALAILADELLDEKYLASATTA